MAFDDPHLMWGHNNQPKVVIDGGGGVRDEMGPGRNV